MALTPPPTWATDANYDAGSDAWSGLPTKRAPSVGEQAKGKIPGQFFFAQVMNYLLNLYSAVMQVFVNHTEDSAAQFGLVATDEYTTVLADSINVRAASLALANWTLLTPNFGGATAKSIAYIEVGSAGGPVRLVVGCTSGAVYTSDDYGSTWTSRTSNTTKSINAWAYDSSQNVLVGVCADAEIITTTDGITYTARASGAAGTPDLLDVCWSSGHGLFIAVGEVDPTNAYVGTSPTGATWTKRTFSVTGSNANLVSVAASDNVTSRVVAVSATRAFLSTNGTSFAAGVDISGIQDHERVVFLDNHDSQFLILGTDGTNSRSASSPDGITWNVGSNFGVGSTVTAGLVAVPFAILGSSLPGACAFTTQGPTWRCLEAGAATVEWKQIGYRPGSFAGFSSVAGGRVFAPSGAANQLYATLHLGAV